MSHKRVLAFDPGFQRMGWASIGWDRGSLYYHMSGVFHLDPILEKVVSSGSKYQQRRIDYVESLAYALPTLFDLTQPDAVVNETVPAVGSFNGTQMYLANVAITVVQTIACQRGLPVSQIGATSVHSKFFPKHKGKVTKPKLRNAVIELFPELAPRKSEWTGKTAIYEEPDAIAIGAVELGYSR
jgi:Holliday junction resolvasome RuvABC endonuclease subunit